jgi:hypothetical protein
LGLYMAPTKISSTKAAPKPPPLRSLLMAAECTAGRVEGRRRAGTSAAGRADQQHAWVLADDERGTFGDYPPAV